VQELSLISHFNLEAMKRDLVNSSTITSIGYSSGDSQLEVEFKTGNIYLYENVSQRTYNQLMNADSIGTAFNYLIREGGYSYKKLKAI
jgi:hypothetical protein